MLDLLALGAEVEVVRPPELRAELARVARHIADLHTDGHSDPGPSSEGGAIPPAVPHRTAAAGAAATGRRRNAGGAANREAPLTGRRR